MNEDFSALIAESNKMIDNRLTEEIQRLNDPKELKRFMIGYKKSYKKSPIMKMTRFLTKRAEREKDLGTREIKDIESAPDFNQEYVITIKWKRSRMWGYNPKAYTNTGFESESIGGCGYDKKSAATAIALNNNKSILKELYKRKCTELSKKNHDLLGYGSGYSLLPCFEGGVGWECHKRILGSVGLDMIQVSNTEHTDVFIVKKVERKE